MKEKCECPLTMEECGTVKTSDILKYQFRHQTGSCKSPTQGVVKLRGIDGSEIWVCYHCRTSLTGENHGINPMRMGWKDC